MKNIFLALFIGFSFFNHADAQQLNNNNDDYWTAPRKPYGVRRQLYLNFCAANNDEGGREGVFSQIARLELGLPVNEAMVREAIAVIYENKDCNDFAAGGLLRLYYINKKKNQLSQKLVTEMAACLISFKYWWDEPEKDIAYRCYHTENHQGLYHQDELLAGQLFKNSLFKNGKTGSQHIKHALLLLDSWLDWRARFGFSEWLSNNYIEVDLLTLANLYDFAEDSQIRSRAGLLIDVIMYEMALNNFHGVFGSTHGRTYNRSVMGGRNENTASTMKLMLGVGIFNSPKAMGAVSLATSVYRCPLIIEKIATDYSPAVSKERQSINVNDAPKYGLSYRNESAIGMYWGMQEFIHPDVIDLSQQVSQNYNVWPYRDYDIYKKQYADQIKQYGKIVNPDLDRYALPEANIETYRTPYFMLSCAQDYKPGTKGYQQHIWQATLSSDAVVFTNHPGENTPNPIGKESSPAYWAGNKLLPRAAQYKNVLICIYNIPADDPLPFSHAYFPCNAFDEVIEKGHWVFGHRDSAYVAIYSQNPVTWQKNTMGRQDELRSTTSQNTWICEMGTQKQWKSFAAFVNKIAASEVNINAIKVQYHSPSAGLTQFGWTGPLTVNGFGIPLKNYSRFDNTYCKNDFTSNKITINYHHQKLVLDFKNNRRIE